MKKFKGVLPKHISILQNIRLGQLKDQFPGTARNRHVSAFTLLELIIALSIGTVLILLVSLSMRMGFFQMEKGSRWLEDRHRESSALHFLCQQVSSMRNEKVGEDVIFDGNPESVVFVTPISLARRYGLGLMMVSYYLKESDKGVRLNYKEKRFIPDKNLSKFKDQNVLMFDNSEEMVIVDGYEAIYFQFLGEQEDGGENENTASSHSDLDWEDIWLLNSLPKAIKIVLSKNGQDKEIIAPVMVMY